MLMTVVSRQQLHPTVLFPILDRLDTATRLAVRCTCQKLRNVSVDRYGVVPLTRCMDAARHGIAFFYWILGGRDEAVSFLRVETHGCTVWDGLKHERRLSELLAGALEFDRGALLVLNMIVANAAARWSGGLRWSKRHVLAAVRSCCIDNVLIAVEFYDFCYKKFLLRGTYFRECQATWIHHYPMPGAFLAACEASKPDVPYGMLKRIQAKFPRLLPPLTVAWRLEPTRERRAICASFWERYIALCFLNERCDENGMNADTFYPVRNLPDVRWFGYGLGQIKPRDMRYFEELMEEFTSRETVNYTDGEFDEFFSTVAKHMDGDNLLDALRACPGIVCASRHLFENELGLKSFWWMIYEEYAEETE